MNNNSGYVLLDASKVFVKDGKLIVPRDKSMPEEIAVEMGFPKSEEIRNRGT